MAFSLDEALGMSLADEADESIHVDIDTRQVTIPESQQVFGVESDEDVEVKHIVIDGRYNDGTDLSTFTFRVNYQNANGDKGTYLVTELKVNDDSIEFDWIIGRQVVAYKGTIAFIVCAYTIDSSSVIQNEWNSTLGKGTVLEGLEVSEFDFGDDIVRQLASILSDVNAAQASAKASADEAYKSKTEVVALGKEQQEAIEKKGKDTLATIPDDYTQVSNDVSQLKEDTAKLKDGKISKFYASSQGNTNLPDSDDGRIMDLKLYGKGSQQQYSGKNLLSTLDVSTSTKLGVTVKSVGAGEISVKGTATADALFDYWGQEISVPKGARVLCKVLQGTGSANNTITFFGTNYTNGISTEFGAVSSSTAGVDYKCVLIRIGIKSGETVDCTIGLSLQMDASTDYEPYVGGIPSPNPEYPQEIKSVVKPVVKVTSQNYLDYKDVGGGVTAPVTLAKGDHYLTRFFLTANEEINNGVEYLRDGTWARINTVGSIENGKIVVSDSAFGWYSKHMKITCTENITIRVATTDTTVIALNDYGYLDKYAEYQAPQTVTLPYTLNAIPVSSGGNVTIDGQQYIADYVDVEKGKLVRMTGKLTIATAIVPGDAHWYDAEKSYSYEIQQGRIAPSIKKAAISSDRLTGYDFGDFYAKGIETGILASESYIVVNISKRFNICTTADEFITWFNESNVIGVLATPTETDLTADEIAAFKALVSYYPVINVSTTSDQLNGYTVFDYPISLANGWNYVKQQIGDTRDYLYGIDLMTAEAYVNSEYAAALAEIEV